MKIKVGALRSLIEAAIQPAQAGEEGLAIRVIETKSTTRVVAYSPESLMSNVQIVLKSNPKTDVVELLQKIGILSIVGLVSLRDSVKSDGPCHGAYIVQTTAARKGYGPLVYDLALSLGRPVIPDRLSVSKHAQKVWRTYLNDRGDVVKLPLDDKKNPKTSDAMDDCSVYPEEEDEKESSLSKISKKLMGKSAVIEPKDPRNYAYEAGTKNKYVSMFQNDSRALPQFNSMIKKFGKKPLIEAEWEFCLMAGSIAYFRDRYKTMIEEEGIEPITLEITDYKPN